VERIWDLVNAIRRTSLDVPPIMGIATDDSHEYHGQPGSRPGRGWVMVRSRYLTPEHLIRAMKQGDFYATSGVLLDEVTFDAKSRTLSLEIQEEPGVHYVTEFIATLDSPSDDPIGRTMKRVEGVTPSYTMQGSELYIRAVVTADRPPTDPSFEGQMQQAWTQPVGWERDAAE
jgi:hypothetical protein